MFSFLEVTTPVVYCVYPVVVLLGFLAAFFASDHASEPIYRKKTIICLLTVFSCTQFVQLLVVILQGYLSSSFIVPEFFVIGTVSCFSLSILQIDALLNNSSPDWYSFRSSWILAIPFEISIALLSTLASTSVWPSLPDSTRVVIVCLATTRSLVLSVLVYPRNILPRILSRQPPCDEERVLLPSEDPTSKALATRSSRMLESSTYGSIRDVGNCPRTNMEDNESPPNEDPGIGNVSSNDGWTRNVKDFVKLTRLIKPNGLRRLQIRAIVVILCLLASILICFLIPIQTARVMNDLYDRDTKTLWTGVLILCTLSFSYLIVSLICAHEWIPFKCFITETLNRKAYSHLLHLSSDFHTSENIAEKAISIQGAGVISDIFEFIFLLFGPWLVQLCATTVYLSFAMVPYQGFLLAGSMFIHLFLTNKIANEVSWEDQTLSKLFHKELSIRYNGFLGWKTINALNQNSYEDNLHSNAVSTRICQEKAFTLKLGQLSGFQGLILALGLAVSLSHTINQVTVGKATVGQLVMLGVFWIQLQITVCSLSRGVQNSSRKFSQASAFFRLLHARPAVYNKQNARPLKRIAGEVKFDCVSFAYGKQKTVINNASITIAGGETVHIIGAKGSGKSTLLKLLNRSFDVTKGAIRIDGQDIRDVDLFSLRDRVGILTDMCFISDDTILNNLRYSRVTASDEEVFQACKAALLHEDILRFPQGYATLVGESGTALSVSELQKIAIARELLRNPDILVLDNATSALDPDTERTILASVTRRCQKCTTFIINHHLPTIADAHRILVIEDGRVVEDGTHKNLMLNDGAYAAIWSRYNASCPAKFRGKLDPCPKDASSSLPEHQLQVTSQGPSFACNESPFIDVTSTPQHVKEGSRLNPIAPTFTPKAPTASREAIRKRNETSTEDSATGTVSKLASSQTSHQWSDEFEEKAEQSYGIEQLQAIGDVTSKTNLDELPFSHSQENNEVISPIRKQPEESAQGMKEEAKQTLPTVADSNQTLADESTDQVPQLENSQFKCPRYSRRIQSKSEPSYVAENTQAEQGQMTRVQDELGSTSANRRVSAPLAHPSLANSNIPRLNVLGKAKVQNAITPNPQPAADLKNEQRPKSKKGAAANNAPDAVSAMQKVMSEVGQDKGTTKITPVAAGSPSSPSRASQRNGRRGRGYWRGRRTRGTRGV